MLMGLDFDGDAPNITRKVATLHHCDDNCIRQMATNFRNITAIKGNM